MDTLPLELVVGIMQQSTTITNLFKLVSVNKYMRDIYNKHANVILNKVAPQHINTFNDALAVVRATKIVKDAYTSGQLPPRPFPLATLTRKHHLPNVDEYRAVVKLIQMVNILEAEHSAFMMELGHNWVFAFRPYISLKDFNQGILHGLLYNAVMAGELAEPFYLSAQGKSGEEGAPKDNHDSYKAIEKDINYLREFWAFKTRYRKKEHDALLNGLAEFFRELGVSSKDLHPIKMQRNFQKMWKKYGSGKYEEDISNTHYSEAPPNLQYIHEMFNHDKHINRILIGLVHTVWQLPGLPHLGKSFNRRRKANDFEEHPAADVILFGEFNVQTISFDPKIGRISRVNKDILWDIYEKTQLALEETCAPRNVEGPCTCLDILERVARNRKATDGKD